MKQILLICFFFLILLTVRTTPLSMSGSEIDPGMLGLNAARYAPGDTVVLTLNCPDMPSGTKLTIKYFHLGNIIDSLTFETSESSIRWKWLPPASDFQGYLAAVSYQDQHSQVQTLSIGIDVSSDWARFPRYGFISKFPQMHAADIQQVISRLNRYHINGLQFYDWHYKHHMPVREISGTAAPFWNDIANRTNYLSTIKGYIDEAHKFSMTAMAYNLLYGAYSNSYMDGVKDEWGLYRDKQHSTRYMYDLPAGWASSIYFMDASNPEWCRYIYEQEKKVFDYLPFDGWHVDQVGDPISVYNYAGSPVIVKNSFNPFLKNAKDFLGVRIVMNAVNQYGQQEIAAAPVEFLYTEPWGPNDTYADLIRIINNNNAYSSNRLNTVLAAYINYKLAENKGTFNSPGVLLADAVIFSAGGAHLELGEHMLGKEYFPNDNLAMSPELDKQLICYYDFLTAYENLLRDSLTVSPSLVSSRGRYRLTSWQQTGAIWYFSKIKNDKQIFHLINLSNANSLFWRDETGTQTEPDTILHYPLNIAANVVVKRIWAASPDFNNGIPVEMDFTQSEEGISFKVPGLKYWTMIVVEFKNTTGGIQTEFRSDTRTHSFIQNYPNPFNSSTKITFEIPETSDVGIYVSDILGRRILTLAENTFVAGSHSLTWNASNVSSGTYFCTMHTPNMTLISKLLLIK